MTNVTPIKANKAAATETLPTQTDARVARGERTRQALIDAAFAEIHRNGYRAASLNDILAAASCTKGSLYHHFPDKHALGLAAISEKVDAFITQNWLTHLNASSDPLTTIREIIERHVSGEILDDPRLGCPVQNLSQEMSSIDEDFREFLDGIFERWIETIAQSLKRGIRAGNVRANIDTRGFAIIVVATHQGMISLIKTAQNPKVGEDSAPTFFALLETLRPSPKDAQ